MDDWGTQIRTARARIGWTQSQLAQASGVTQATISRIESGDRWPNRSTVESLLSALRDAAPEPAMTVPMGEPEHHHDGRGELVELQVTELLGTEPEAIDWLVDGLLARGAVTMLAGRYGQGKSLFAQSVAVAVAQGWGELAGWMVQPGKVLIVDAENGANLIHTRLLGLGLDADGAGRLRVATARAFDIERDRSKLDATIAADVPDLLVLDTWTSLWMGSESSVEQVQECLNGLRDLAKRYNCAVLLLHHTTKSGEGFRGSSAIGATIEGVFLLDRPDDDEPAIREVVCEKLRIGPEPKPHSFRVGYPITEA